MIWSVSLIFYYPNLGYLVGQELRKKEKDFIFQPVGGKVEVFDKDPLDTGVREFIEETTLLMHSFFGDIANENFEKWTKDNPITLNTKYPRATTWIQKELYDYCSVSNVFYDYKLLNSHKVHRFYVVDISNINNNELNKNITQEILHLPYTYTMIEPQLRICDKMWSLFWIPFSQLKNLPQPSNLINVFFDKRKGYENNLKNNNYQKHSPKNNNQDYLKNNKNKHIKQNKPLIIIDNIIKEDSIQEKNNEFIQEEKINDVILSFQELRVDN